MSDVLTGLEIALTVRDDMTLLINPNAIAMAGNHNSAVFLVSQPPQLDALACRAEVLTNAGRTYRLVQDGSFLLTSDIAVAGLGYLQLVYGDGVDINIKTTQVQFYVAQSIDALDQSDPDFQDGLAQLAATSFADAEVQGPVLIFRNIGGAEVDRVTLPGVDIPALNAQYLRRDGTNQMDGSVAITGPNRGVIFDVLTSAAAVYSTGTNLIMRKPVGNANVLIEDNGGDAGTRSPVLTEAMADVRYDARYDARYLTQGAADIRYLQTTGGIMTGPIRTIGLGPPQLDTLVWREWVEQQIAAIPPGGPGGGLDEAQADTLYLRQDGTTRMRGNILVEGAGTGIVLDVQQAAAVVYADGTLRLRRGSTNAEPTIENNDGNPGSRQPLINQSSGDARYVQRTGGAGASMSGTLQINGAPNGIQFSTTAFIYAPAAGIVLRRGLVGNYVYTEANNGDVATRRRFLTEDDMAPSALLMLLADLPLTDNFQNVFPPHLFSIPRGGNSRVKLTITGGLRFGGISQLSMVQLQATPGDVTRNCFTYSVDSGSGVPEGASISMTFALDVTGTSPAIACGVRQVGAGPALVLIGSNFEPQRTQVLIEDMGAR